MRRKVRLGGRVVNSSILLQVVMRTGVVIGSILRHGSSWDKGVGTGKGTSVWDSAWVTYITSTGACGRTRVEARDLLGNEASQGDSNGSGPEKLRKRALLGCTARSWRSSASIVPPKSYRRPIRRMRRGDCAKVHVRLTGPQT